MNLPSTKATKMIHVRLTPEQYRHVRKYASQRGISLMSATREALLEKVSSLHDDVVLTSWLRGNAKFRGISVGELVHTIVDQVR